MNYNFIREKTPIFLLTAIACSIPLLISLGNITLITAFIFSAYIFFYEKKGFSFLQQPEILFPLLLYVLIFINGLTGSNFNQFFRELDKNALLFLIPFTLAILYKTNYHLTVLKYFTIILSLTTFLLILNNGVKLINGKQFESLFFHDFTLLLDQHAVYFSLYLALGILFSIDQIKKKLISTSEVKLYSLSILVSSIGLLFCASKAVIIALFFILFIQLVLQKNTSIKKFLFLGIIAIGIAFTVFFNPYLNERFTKGLGYNLEFSPTNKIEEAKVFSNREIDYISGLEIRVIFAKIAVYHLIDDHKILFGYSVSDVQDHLDYYYMYYGLAPFHYEGFSPHNQYIYTFVSMGIIGLLLLLSYLIYSFFSCIKKKNTLHFLFLLLFCFAMLFETYFLRNKGIMFFFFFNTLFLIKNKDQ